MLPPDFVLKLIIIVLSFVILVLVINKLTKKQVYKLVEILVCLFVNSILFLRELLTIDNMEILLRRLFGLLADFLSNIRHSP